MLRLARHARDLTGAENLVLAGGIALNCVATGKLVREKIFKNIWVQPAAGDAGGALGAALFAYYGHFHQPRNPAARDTQKGSFLGTSYTPAAVKKYLDGIGAKYREYSDKTTLYGDLAELLANGNVAGFFNGRMEFGPRALGGRSILADTRNPEMQAKLNLKIKLRESFRPYAPAVLAEKVGEYFDFAGESPYMLVCADVKKERRKPFALPDGAAGELDLLPIVRQERSDIPAVTHVDYSARLQTVNAADNPDFHALLSEFDRQTGCAVLVNTSFNVRGEPIVESPADAYQCFMRTDMDVLVIENFLLRKRDHPKFADAENWREKYALD
jgi:carbamoyltransferase